MAFLSWDFGFDLVPLRRSSAGAGGLRPHQVMEIDDDPTAKIREHRFNALVTELYPRVRRFNPMTPADQVLEMAESMAELRLLDEEME